MQCRLLRAPQLDEGRGRGPDFRPLAQSRWTCTVRTHVVQATALARTAGAIKVSPVGHLDIQSYVKHTYAKGEGDLTGCGKAHIVIEVYFDEKSSYQMDGNSAPPDPAATSPSALCSIRRLVLAFPATDAGYRAQALGCSQGQICALARRGHETAAESREAPPDPLALAFA